MYPFPSERTFVENSWYVGGTVEELNQGPFERTILGKPVVFFRAESGEPRALHALCPHRSYPLARRGRVIGNSIQCAYHGFAFDGSNGQCVLVPAQDRPPGQYRQRVYPVCERGPWIWIWAGDAEAVNFSSIPANTQIDMGEGWVTSRPTSFVGVKGRYMLLVENLFDLTHVGFLHGDLGEFDAIISAPMKIDETAEIIRVVRQMSTGWTDFHEALFGLENRFQGLSTFDSVTRYFSPGYVTTSGYITQSINGQEFDRQRYGSLYFHHAITPETSTSCHYFGTTSRDFRLDDPYFDAEFRSFDIAVRQQDVDAAEAIEDHFDRFGEPAVELLVKSDGAAGRVRRHIQKLIESANTKELLALAEH